MRDCRLDEITFINPWRLVTFKLDRVGLDVYYACGSTEELVETPAGSETCRGPVGDLFRIPPAGAV